MTLKMIPSLPKFIQLVSSEKSLTALDDNGDVWTYVGRDKGWSPLNMKRITGPTPVSAYRQEFERPRV